MKLEDQLSNLELSKRLKELGVPQESLWWWLEHKEDKVMARPYIKSFDDEHFKKQAERFHNIYSAFTVAELGEMLLPNLIEFIINDLDNFDRNLYFEYCNIERPLFNPNFLAKILIHLLENKLINPKKGEG